MNNGHDTPTRNALDAIRDDLSRSGLWCGEATLEAFGVTVRGKIETCQAGVVTSLRRAGYTVEYADGHAPWDTKQGSLRRFIREHPEGDWFIFTADHNMALRDGVLTDTDLDGTDLRRVQTAYRVTR